MADYAVNLDFWDRIQPKIRSWEIAHQRPMPKSQYQALVEGELSVATSAAAARAERGRALDLEQEKMDLAKQQAEDAKDAAKVKGITDIGTTAIMGKMAWDQVGINKANAAANERLTEYIISGGKGGAKPAISYPTTPAETYGADLTAPQYAPADVGAYYGKATPASFEVGGTAPAIDFGAPTVAEAGFELGGQAALTKTAPILSTETSFAASAAETEAIAAGTTAEGTAAGTTGSTSALGTTALSVGAGFATKYIADKLGANQETSNIAGGVMAGMLIMGGPVGIVLGGLIGLGAGEIFDSVVCSELLRQGRISKRDREWCVVFKHRYIDDRMFAAYLDWASPHVSAMRGGGWRNSVRLPFALAFVNYMMKVAKHKEPSWFEKAVYAHCWRQCEKIADYVPVGAEVNSHA